MFKYHKIYSPFLRSTDGDRKLLYGCFTNSSIEYLANNEWEFTEKIDGTNIRIYWDGHKVSFAGRTERSIIPENLLNFLNEIFGLPEAEVLFEQEFGEDPVVLFGEGYGGKIQNGKNYRPSESFILFDVSYKGIWLNRKEVKEIAKMFGIDSVPVVLRGTIQDAIDMVKSNPKSTIGNAFMEGLIGRPSIELKTNNGDRIIVKVKCRDFQD